MSVLGRRPLCPHRDSWDREKTEVMEWCNWIKWGNYSAVPVKRAFAPLPPLSLDCCSFPPCLCLRVRERNARGCSSQNSGEITAARRSRINVYKICWCKMFFPPTQRNCETCQSHFHSRYWWSKDQQTDKFCLPQSARETQWSKSPVGGERGLKKCSQAHIFCNFLRR